MLAYRLRASACSWRAGCRRVGSVRQITGAMWRALRCPEPRPCDTTAPQRSIFISNLSQIVFIAREPGLISLQALVLSSSLLSVLLNLSATLPSTLYPPRWHEHHTRD